ncbi:aminotransferase class I/II-fold pyridoxal phosphate-dependent enzyme [Marivirga sp. S37H4]|uniref:Aminotransferase class I/II-fold pyridoxal phosphate-dependent enzyme n=1 Tax=Marivirga aurantiaca TaxID=2802615 RepID=A0A935CB15_9BACT|nr:aminotransferase class I/II-fold pyridoxal phosphate-dependent enzyme [Marivirga aurantiaca]MBK6266905.1 aminotransferase class I/II-fold pyridoxal phosphate-dependent enzyme [Marivirga aurantiaca]
MSDNVPNPKKHYHLFDDDNLDHLYFDISKDGEIDANKYSLYNFTGDPKLEYAEWESRMDMMNSWFTDMKSQNRFLYERESINGSKVISKVVDPKTGEIREMLNFASNDYLNLTQDPRIWEKVKELSPEYGGGAGGVPLLSGSMTIIKQLARKIADMKGMESAIVYSSGYGANYGTISGLLGHKDVAIYDMFAHASLIDGSRGSNKKFFQHNDPVSLEKVLKANQNNYINKLVVVDGVYSMDGDIVKLNEILDIAHYYGAWVLVDEAHATGVIGKTGLGTLEHFGLEGKVDIITGTLSKAVGSIGGYVAASERLINYLKYTSRSYMFSTSPYIPSVVASLEALNLITEQKANKDKLWENINYVKKRLTKAGFNIGNAETAIFPIIIGDDNKVKEMTFRLHEKNIFVNPVPYPAVPRKLTRVRMTVTAGFNLEQLKYTLDEIERIGVEMEIISPVKANAV